MVKQAKVYATSSEGGSYGCTEQCLSLPKSGACVTERENSGGISLLGCTNMTQNSTCRMKCPDSGSGAIKVIPNKTCSEVYNNNKYYKLCKLDSNANCKGKQNTADTNKCSSKK